MIQFAGLDVHRQMVRASIADEKGDLIHEETFPCDRPSLERFAQTRLTPQDHLALEATFNTWEIVSILSPFVARVVVSNPLQTKAIAQAKVKSDKVDARVLCHLLRLNYLPEVWAPDQPTLLLRTLTGRRSTLVSERTRLKNRIHSVLAERLIPLPVPDLFSAKGMAWLKTVELLALDRLRIDSDLRLLAQAESELSQMDQELCQRAHLDPRVKLLMTLPGIDYAVAQCVLAALGEISRFQDGDHAASYLGLTPSLRQSADRCYLGPITRHGNGKARWMLIQAAQHAAKHPGPLGVFMRRLLKKKNRNIAVVATARKLVVIAWHMLNQNEPYRYAQPRPTQNKLARLRVKATGKKRVGGTKKGEPRSPRYGSGEGIRRTPSLPKVLEQEGLPPAKPLKQGEHKSLQSMQIQEYFQSIQSAQTHPRKHPTKRVGGERSLAAEGNAQEQDRANGKASLPADAIKGTGQLQDFALPALSTCQPNLKA